MELHEVEILVDRAKKLYPNDELTAEFIWSRILCDYEMYLKEPEEIKNFINKNH